MAPPVDTEADSGTVSSSDSDPMPAPSILRHPKVKRRNRKMNRQVMIKDLSVRSQGKARKWDLDKDGALDEAEMTMMDYDIDGDGILTAAEIHAIVQDLLRDRSSISAMRKIIAGLMCFVVILSLSNLGTSIASALLVKETTADASTAEMKILGTNEVMGTQASAETFTALEMDVNTRRARRNLVVDSLMADPHGEHAHRRLTKKCKGKKCDGNIKFDVNYMKQKDVETIRSKCKQGRLINIARDFPGGAEDEKGLCRSGSTIVVKEKKNLDRFSHYQKGKKKIKKAKGFQMNIRSDSLVTVFDCDGKDCYMSGSNLLNAHGEPCNLNHGSDDCEPGLVCIQDRDDISSGTCSASWDDAIWYVDWKNNKCVQSCKANSGPNCGGFVGQMDEQFASHTLCCDNYFSFLKGGYSECVPDLNFHLGQGRDCTDQPDMCKGPYKCKGITQKGRSYCV